MNQAELDKLAFAVYMATLEQKHQQVKGITKPLSATLAECIKTSLSR
jgi:hypothetical protein